MTTAFYPGSFDPVTNGHLDILTRASTLFDEVVIGVYDAPPKQLLFTTEERADLLQRSIPHLSNVRVETYTELTVEVARRVGAKALVRGLRMGSDFDYEFEMALMNRKLAPDIETVCLMTTAEFVFVSSRLLKEAVALGGDIGDLVPPEVAVALRRKYGVPAQSR